MAGKYLLDTNILIALFADEASVTRNVIDASEVFLPSIAVGELYYGARKSNRRHDNLARIDGFVTQNIVLGCDLETARHYGEIKDQLRIKGRPIPENDIWIAAVAKQHGLTLVTRDIHFKEIESLEIASW